MRLKKERHELVSRIQPNIYIIFLECQMIIAFAGLRNCNCRILIGKIATATILRAVIKSHKGLKGAKVFACGYSWRNIKIFSKFTGKSPCWSKVAAWKSLFLKSRNKDYSVNINKTEAPTLRLLHKYLPVNFENIMNTNFEHLCENASEMLSKRGFVM